MLFRSQNVDHFARFIVVSFASLSLVEMARSMICIVCCIEWSNQLLNMLHRTTKMLFYKVKDVEESSCIAHKLNKMDPYHSIATMIVFDMF